MNDNALRYWLRRPESAFACDFGTALQIEVFRVTLSFVIQMYSNADDRSETRRLMGAGEELGFQLSGLFTYVNPDGVESDYVQAVLNASSLKTAKEKIIAFLHVASRG